MKDERDLILEAIFAECANFFQEVGMDDFIQKFLEKEDVEQTIKQTHERLLRYLRVIVPNEDCKEKAEKLLNAHQSAYDSFRVEVIKNFKVAMMRSTIGMLEEYGEDMMYLITDVVDSQLYEVCWIGLKTICDAEVLNYTEEFGRIVQDIPEEVFEITKSLCGASCIIPEEVSALAKAEKEANNQK